MKKILFLVLLPIILISCNKEIPVGHHADARLTISHNVSGSFLIYDSLLYYNAAQNLYSVTRVEYYLSGFTFRKDYGEHYIAQDVLYLNAFDESNDFKIKGIPEGEYSGLSFYIGVDPKYNISGALPSTMENLNMAWPDQMGGGYHFLKFEGHYKSADTIKGYATHLGLNPNLIKITFNEPFTITAEQQLAIDLSMDMNKWFEEPNLYDLTKDKVYTMGDMEAMAKIAENGKTVFELKQIK